MSETRTYGIVAEYDNVTDLMAAAKRVRDAGYKRWDVHTPFPVHGLDGAMGIQTTILPWIVLGAGLSGMGLSALMMWFMNAYDYPLLISGKPIFSLAANVPVIFESTILFSALTCFFGVFLLNGMPTYYHPLFRLERFKRATNDRFFIAIEARDPKFDRQATEALLASTGSPELELCEEPVGDGELPAWTKAIAVIGITLAALPFALAYRARHTKTDTPRYHLVGDMDFQPKYKPQSASLLFEDGRAMRPQVEGTVARGELFEDKHYNYGKVGFDWATEFPKQVPLTMETMERGRQRFEIYCSACHGYSGDGNGIVSLRAQELKQPSWVPPTSLHADHIKKQSVGKLYDAITNGVRSMPSYRAQIQRDDRWAIVFYLRALQRQRAASIRPANRSPG